MAIQDMDISLNVTTEPVFSARNNKLRGTESSKTSIKRLKNQSFGKKGLVVNNKESKNINAPDTEPKKRIKQKSLSAIFAKRLKGANSVTQNALLQILSGVKDVAKERNAESEKIKQSNSTDKNSKSNKVLSAASSDSANEQTISFAKVTKQCIGETLLARKRDTLIEQKKSLSDIFASRLKNESNKDELNMSAKHDIDKDNKSNKKSEIVHEKSPTLNITGKISNKNNERKRKGKIVNNHRESDKIHKTGGKISSLFGNNPDVPTIGQRSVKPVDEPIFTEITFADLNVHPFMISNLEQNMHITKMTTVQQKAIPEIFSARDVLIRSQTGSGKTLAYALPIVELLHKIRPKLSRNSGLSALVVVPTRELALQTYECFIKLVKPFTWIVPGYIIGGEKRKAEKARLRKGCNILITTPGRLLDHIRHTQALRLNEVRYFVLDEADRMLDMGYEKDISEIVNALKMSSSDSGYDAMKILKQNIKNISNDKEDDIKSCNKMEENHINSNIVRHVYFSSDDSDNENQVTMEGKEALAKKREEGTEYLNTNQESNSKESVQKTEHDCKDISQSRRQTILLSATLTQAIEKLAGLTMRNPIFVDAAKENLVTSGGDTSEINEDLIVPQSVIQSYIVTPPKLRMVTLSAYIVSRCQIPGKHKILIFMATQDMVDYHIEILSSVLTKPMDDDDEDSDPLIDVEFFKLHGNMTQKERTEVFKTFSQTKSGVLLCTDVAARGLDMPKVDCVVQYTGPISARDYVHRIGRTARAGSSGAATIFLTPPEIEFVRMLESRRIRIKQQDMNDVLDKLLGPLSKHNSVQAAAVALQNNFENLILEDKQLGAKACKAYISWIRFYSSYPRDMREIFNRKELHLGHYAKSFALRDPPQRIGGIGKKLREKESSRSKHDNRLHKPSDRVPQKEQRKQNGDGQRTGLLKKARMLNTSEYDSGLGPLKKPKK